MKYNLIQIMPNHGDHLWHVFMNHMNKGPEDWDRTIYEFKRMIQWLQYGHEKIAQAFEERLPSTHKQCSHSPSEVIPENTLVCAIGKNVKECQILKDLRAVVDEHKKEDYYADFTEESLYKLMSLTCSWHILNKATGMTNAFSLDTSEGFMLDTSDRMFWERTYRNMAATEPEAES